MEKTHRKNMTQEATAQVNTQEQILAKQLGLTLLACILMLVFMQAAYATQSAMGDVLCSIVGIVYGNLGRGLATLAVVVIGVGATLGKTSWGLAMTVAVGISVIFNAAQVVNYLGSGAGGCAIIN